jgi:hypothetical protein
VRLGSDCARRYGAVNLGLIVRAVLIVTWQELGAGVLSQPDQLTKAVVVPGSGFAKMV